MPYKIQVAFKARLPFITITTRDTVNLFAVLQELAPKTALGTKMAVVAWDGPTEQVKKDTIYVFIRGAIQPAPAILAFRLSLQKAKSMLIIVNPNPQDHDFDLTVALGELPTPPKMMAAMLKDVVLKEEDLKATIAALGGVTLKEAEEISFYSSAEHGSFTAKGLAKSRNELFRPQKGLYPVHTEQDFYEPAEVIKTWVAKEKKFFLWEPDHRLRPRGLMLAGPSGTGKSEAAKYIAGQFEVPLYRLDLATTQDKYVGNSARFLQSNLDMLDQQEPCVVLIDEVEKVIGGNQGGWVTDLLSMMLWWMQTHTSRVLTICTTNDLSIIPKEFHRPGRIDETIALEGLKASEVDNFIKHVLTAYGHGKNDILAAKIKDQVKGLATQGNNVAPAKVTGLVINLIKDMPNTTPKKLIFKKSA